MLQLILNKEKNNAHFIWEFSGIKIHIRPYFYVEHNKLVNGYVGLIFNKELQISFSTYSESGILPLEEVLIIITKELQQEDFFNEEVSININTDEKTI